MKNDLPCHKSKMTADYLRQKQIDLLHGPENNIEMNPEENI